MLSENCDAEPKNSHQQQSSLSDTERGSSVLLFTCCSVDFDEDMVEGKCFDSSSSAALAFFSASIASFPIGLCNNTASSSNNNRDTN